MLLVSAASGTVIAAGVAGDSKTDLPDFVVQSNWDFASRELAVPNSKNEQLLSTTTEQEGI